MTVKWGITRVHRVFASHPSCPLGKDCKFETFCLDCAVHFSVHAAVLDILKDIYIKLILKGNVTLFCFISSRQLRNGFLGIFWVRP